MTDTQPEFSLNVVLVWMGDKYPIQYLLRIRQALEHQLRVAKLTWWCITDNPTPSWIKPVKPKLNVPGWWNKIQVFDPETTQFSRDKTLYLDLDQLIIGSIDHWFKPFLQSQSVLCYADHIGHGGKFGSALMFFKPSYFEFIWSLFYDANQTVIRQMTCGDQQFLGAVLPESRVEYLDEWFPGEIVSYKYDLRGEEPTAIMKLVNFHGYPKPDEVANEINWVKRYWYGLNRSGQAENKEAFGLPAK